jgi:hypothetical protein
MVDRQDVAGPCLAVGKRGGLAASRKSNATTLKMSRLKMNRSGPIKCMSPTDEASERLDSIMTISSDADEVVLNLAALIVGLPVHCFD